MAKGYITEIRAENNPCIEGAKWVEVVVRHHFHKVETEDANCIDDMDKFLQGLEDCDGETMVLTRTGSRCVYCDHEVDDPNILEKMAAHIWECDKHPLARVAKLVDALRVDIADSSSSSPEMQAAHEFCAEVARNWKGFIDCAREEDERVADDAP